MREKPRDTARSPCASGREVEPGRVRRSDDGGNPVQGRNVEAEFLDHGVKGTPIAAMAPEHALDVEWSRRKSLGHVEHFRGGHKQKDGIRIDEAANEPRAGDAVDFGRARVTQTVRPATSRCGGSLAVRKSGCPALLQAVKPPSESRPRAPRDVATLRRPG